VVVPIVYKDSEGGPNVFDEIFQYLFLITVIGLDVLIL